MKLPSAITVMTLLIPFFAMAEKQRDWVEVINSPDQVLNTEVVRAVERDFRAKMPAMGCLDIRGRYSTSESPLAPNQSAPEIYQILEISSENCVPAESVYADLKNCTEITSTGGLPEGQKTFSHKVCKMKH